MSIARQLSRRPDTNVLVIERHSSAGQETSSRNSEVIHAGLYYGADSLKTKLCLRGKELMYKACAQHGIRQKWRKTQCDCVFLFRLGPTAAKWYPHLVAFCLSIAIYSVWDFGPMPCDHYDG